MHSATQRAATALAVAVVVVAVLHTPALSSTWTSTDDTPLILDDTPFLLSDGAALAAFRRPFFPAEGHRQRYYRPLVTASFVADAAIEPPPSAVSFHRTNVLLHAATTALVALLAESLGLSPVYAAGVGLLFGFHPSVVETVAWVPGRSDGLMAVFALAAMVAWFRSSREVDTSRRWLAVHVACFALALLSKETAIVVPFLCALHAALVEKKPALLRAPGIWAAWAAVFAGYAVLRWRALGAAGASAESFSVSNAGLAGVISYGKLFLPIEHDVLATVRDSSWVPGVAALGLVAAAARRVHVERRRAVLWALGIVPLFALAPTLLVADFLILDNRLYLPLAGVAIGLALAVDDLLAQGVVSNAVLHGAFGVLVIVAGALTVRRARAFESPRAFCEAAVDGSPHLGLAHLNLGAVEYKDGNFHAAEREFRVALECNPSEPSAHNDLGLLHLDAGELGPAESEFLAELALNPNYSKAHYNLGLVLSRTGREEAARDHFERAVAIAPGDISSWGELLKYWGRRDLKRSGEIVTRMETLGVRFETFGGSQGPQR